MNAKNKFKNEVVKTSIKLGMSHPEAVKAVNNSLESFTDKETAFTHFGAEVGGYSFGGCAKTDSFSYWPTGSNDGSIVATGYIVHIR